MIVEDSSLRYTVVAEDLRTQCLEKGASNIVIV